MKTEYAELYLDGSWRKPVGGAVDDVINPATESAFGKAPVGGADDCDRALAAARKAFDEGPWPRMSRKERIAKMRKVYDVLAGQRQRVDDLAVLEMGFARAHAPLQREMGYTHFERFMELAAQDTIKPLRPTLTQTPGGKMLGSALIVREPIGVVSAITPYNAGFLLGLMKTVPGLLWGNTVVLKPSEYTPLQSLMIAEAMAEADLPPGVFNVVTGGAEVGSMLSSDPRVDMVSFTGSDAIGSRVMQQAAATLKKVHLELGGKSAMIVRADADLDMAAGSAIYSFVFQTGQGCSNTTRHLVHNSVRNAYVERLKTITSGVKVGDPMDPTTGMGPLIREVARKRTEMFVERALKEGAELVHGGKRPGGLDKGFFYEPTIFNNVKNNSHLAQEEVFGPIAAVIGFDTDEEAVKIANDSKYGLGGAIWSRDAGTAYEMALQVRTGMISINGGGASTDTPFGGYKRSGIGREWGEEGFNEFSEIKSVTYHAA